MPDSSTCQLPYAHRRTAQRLKPDRTAFATLKAIPRAKAARTVKDLWNTIKQAFRLFTPDECRNYFVAEGGNAFEPTRSNGILASLV